VFSLQFLGSFLLILTVAIIIDPLNGPAPIGMIPIAVYFVVVGIGAAFGLQTGHSKLHGGLVLP